MEGNPFSWLELYCTEIVSDSGMFVELGINGNIDIEFDFTYKFSMILSGISKNRLCPVVASKLSGCRGMPWLLGMAVLLLKSW